MLILVLYTSLLLSIIHVLGASLHTWQEIVTISDEVYQHEYRMRACARYLSLKNNLQSSIRVISFYRPQVSLSQLQQAVHNLYLSYPSPCTTDASELGIRIYREYNSSLPDFYPNYYFHFTNTFVRGAFD